MPETVDHVCDSGNFDRTLCPEPCGTMHSYCNTCGKRADACAHEPVSESAPLADPIAAAPDRDVAEGIRRLIDSAYGTDAIHGLIARALADAGCLPPSAVAAREQEAARRALDAATTRFRDELICCPVDDPCGAAICHWGHAAVALVNEVRP